MHGVGRVNEYFQNIEKKHVGGVQWKNSFFFLENDIFTSAFIIIPPLVKVIEILKEKRKKMVRCKHFDHLNNICYSMVENAVNISHGVLQKQWIKVNCCILIQWYFERVFISRECKLLKVLFIFR